MTTNSTGHRMSQVLGDNEDRTAFVRYRYWIAQDRDTDASGIESSPLVGIPRDISSRALYLPHTSCSVMVEAVVRCFNDVHCGCM